ncbi:MAG: energy transducer TonB [Leptothrix sp. (in: b-proteobacteria)]
MSAVFPSQGGFSFPAQALRASLPDYRSQTASGKRGTGLAVVVGLHVLVGWALASGLASKAVELVRQPIEMAIIPEVTPPPPPPPPPKIEKVRELPKLDVPPPPAYVPPPEVVPLVAPPPPVIQAVQAEPPKAPVVIAPPPPPAPPAPVVAVVAAPPAPPAPVKQEISLACPGYQAVLAQALEDAFERVGVVGTVRTLIKVRGNQVVEVQPQSGPKDYFKYVQGAVKRMRCSAGGADEVLVTLDILFKA